MIFLFSFSTSILYPIQSSVIRCLRALLIYSYLFKKISRFKQLWYTFRCFRFSHSIYLDPLTHSLYWFLIYSFFQGENVAFHVRHLKLNRCYLHLWGIISYWILCFLNVNLFDENHDTIMTQRPSSYWKAFNVNNSCRKEIMLHPK